MMNARSLVKPDAPSALSTELSSNNIDVCFVSETWLNSNISSNLLYVLMAIIFYETIVQIFLRVVVLPFFMKTTGKYLTFTLVKTCECSWCEIQKYNAKYFVAILYHPPNPNYPECELLEYLSNKCEEILFLDSSARIIIAGDINQLPVNDFCTQHNLQQLVSNSTRGQRILDMFITNFPYLWKPPSVFKGLVRSDHMTIIVNPCVQVKPERKHVYFRDVREHRKSNMEKCFQKCDWSSIYNTNDVDKATTLLNDKVSSIFNESFPLIKVKVSTRDPPRICHLWLNSYTTNVINKLK